MIGIITLYESLVENIFMNLFVKIFMMILKCIEWRAPAGPTDGAAEEPARPPRRAHREGRHQVRGREDLARRRPAAVSGAGLLTVHHYHHC